MPQRNHKIPTLYLNIRATGRGPRFFKKQVKKPKDPVPPGSLVYVKDKEGRPVGTGFYNPRTTIALRLIDRGSKPAGHAVVQELLAKAIAFREDRLQLGRETEAYRLVHAEGDGLPGLIVDKLGKSIVASLSIRGLVPYMEQIGEQLLRRYKGSNLVLSIHDDDRERENIEIPDSGPGKAHWIREHGLHYYVTPGGAHKTGYFCDQRENRRYFGSLCEGRRVLDLCCNAAGFAMHAAMNKARDVHAMDLDEGILEVAKQNIDRNKLRIRTEKSDAFDTLRDLKKGSFDAIVLDPPKWVRGKAEMDKGLEKYRDLNRNALAKLPSGGLLVTCSCSGLVPEFRFIEVLRDAAARAGRDARILRIAGAGPDHPVALECLETRYLKVVFLEVR